MDSKCPENVFSPLVHLQNWQIYALVFGLSMTNLLTWLSNIAVILSIFKTNQQRTIFCLLVLSLSLSDCLSAFIGQTLVFTTFLKPNINCTLKLTTQFLATFTLNISMCIIIATTFDKMIHINKLRPRERNVSMKSAYIIWLICVILAFLIASCYTLFTFYRMFNSFYPISLITTSVGVAAVFLSYMTMYRRICLHIEKTSTIRRTSSSRRNAGQTRPVYLLSTAKVIKRILIAVFIAYVPAVTVNLCWHYDTNVHNSKYLNWFVVAMYISFLLTYSNSTLNAIIFILGNRKSKRFVSSIWHGNSRTGEGSSQLHRSNNNANSVKLAKKDPAK